MSSPCAEDLMTAIDMMLAGEMPAAPAGRHEHEEYGQLLAIAKTLIEFDFYVLNPNRPKPELDITRYAGQELNDEELDMVAGGLNPEAQASKLFPK